MRATSLLFSLSVYLPFSFSLCIMSNAKSMRNMQFIFMFVFDNFSIFVSLSLCLPLSGRIVINSIKAVTRPSFRPLSSLPRFSLPGQTPLIAFPS